MGTDNIVGDTVISGTFLQDNSIVIPLYPTEFPFITMLDNSTEIPRHQRKLLRRLRVKILNRR
ncbi:hypothetical protein F5Y12DRAFT_731714 [Xylaria sp. FL1777]|nr:hypothetical protein F5Y12DRAFT_731714 [Xylaria sp. FL1777]